jgi:glutamate dehydrogenase
VLLLHYILKVRNNLDIAYDRYTKTKNQVNMKIQDVFQAFSKAFMGGLQKDDFIDHHPLEMSQILDGIWSIGKKRENDQTLIETQVIQSDQNSWLNNKTRIFVVSRDCAFIIDSVTAELNRRNLTIKTIFHPVVSVRRDSKGTITQAANRDDKNGVNESWIVIEIQGVLDQAQQIILKQELARVMSDVILATRDWKAMQTALLSCVNDIKNNGMIKHKTDTIRVTEYAAFLQYLYDNNFTLLGYREYTFSKNKTDVFSSVIIGKSLGLLSDERQPVYLNKGSISLPQDLQKIRVDAPLVSVYKVNRRSSVHRVVPLDAIAIKVVDGQGHVVGEKLFIGLFTSVTYSRSVADVPLIRAKIAQVVEHAHFAQASHDHRALAHILEKYPRDELFQMSVEQIHEHASGILRLQDRPRVALYARVDSFRRYISCLVYVPRERYETKLRLSIQSVLEQELSGRCDNFYTTLDDSPLARVMFIIAINQNHDNCYDFKVIEQKIVSISLTWSDHLRVSLMEKTADKNQAIALAHTYSTAFDSAYQNTYTPETAVVDIERIEKTIKNGQIIVDFKNQDTNILAIKLYHPHKAASLSDVLPILENMGLRVESELPFRISLKDSAQIIWIHEFHLKCAASVVIDDVKSEAEDALKAIWYGQAENDLLNALVMSAGLNWRDVIILRGYTKYMQQARVPYTPSYIMKALTDYPVLASALVGYFHANNDPCIPDASRKIGEWNSIIVQSLEAVSALDQDRIIRFIKSLIDATLRTNFYQRDEHDAYKPVLAFKFDSNIIASLPDPRPWREIFIYSPRVEGIHLRGGKIARGGIRWSDRPEDFRTEILGLMQAQMVKNAVIVPEGAKGGFVLKKLPENPTREVCQAEGIACYKMFVRGLLDITDNLQGNKISHPENVIRHDGDDPYLVVAADKGTAKFSDIANALSAEYGFWLGDAFASGGSAGYDHKEVGITARGAWECIKRHFRELGHDIQKQAFDVIGIGDMAGDVFGNGMLLSKKIKLVGAFNHAHIFCDPNPDMDTSWKERKRLFEGVKGWDEYNQSLLSAGGRIYNRREKSLLLTKEIRARFKITAEKISPAELMHAMLKTQCDLLYFGGIGTYIKGDNQTHADASDRSNDQVRVDASLVNAKVLGEGANLAVTRRARIEMGLRGIKLNADFIDNSGGVDCSDHEVNIKILLQDVMRSKQSVLNLEQRNKLLKDMTDEVASLVLRNNHQQSQAISLAEIDAVQCLPTHARFIELLELQDNLKRSVEGLPSTAEIELRLRDNKGLTRSELATLVSLAKIRIKKALLSGSLIDDPLAQDWLINYFPAPIVEKYKPYIIQHRLRREIIAAQMTASIVNRLGPTFLMTVAEKRGADIELIAQACFIARQAYDLKPLWHAIEALDGKISADTQLKSMKLIARLIEATTVWILRHGKNIVQKKTLAKTSENLAVSVRVIKDNLDQSLPLIRKQRVAEYTKAMKQEGMPEKLAIDLAHLGPLRSAPDIIRISGHDVKKISTTATLFFHLGDALHFDWLRAQARRLSGVSFWQSEAIDGVLNQLYTTQADLTRLILDETEEKLGPHDLLELWKEKNGSILRQFETMLNDMRRVSQLDLAMLTLVEQRLRQLCG